MSRILAGFALILLPGVASAECTCTCLGSRAVPICQPQALVEPICQQICTDKIEQSLAGGGAGGGVGGSIGMSGASGGGIDRAMLNSLLGR